MPDPQPHCPLLKQDCIRERCMLWQHLPVSSPGPLAGSVKAGLMAGCSLTLAAFFLGRLNNLAELAPPPPTRRAG